MGRKFRKLIWHWMMYVYIVIHPEYLGIKVRSTRKITNMEKLAEKKEVHLFMRFRVSL
jgi:hypothetical protein